MTNHVWSLFFIREYDDAPDEEKLLGIYSTEELANAARERAMLLPEFKEMMPNDKLVVWREDLDSDGWESGFVHVD
ncbi:MAG: hypothetical protein JO055_07605 [Alphaproteobacteria bacterium]|nr:hypothetical protein [Alphaproteobacteria bacterium]